ncbi:glycosyltransferase family 39 protein [Streptomyces luteolus]|uniref:Glycosyltransferase family 39 protein n=1 Tax=Streptomyces luteolus TaxID=3043615 RepID=A0ABT6T1F4_9ACTN|nr:glycosyltransferase family 39 protein [Streptomyces sp. B-S-A12]MDI3421697.1 glycosyltransferase family 39 protein [Streptomyces sp. B-S-A12]
MHVTTLRAALAAGPSATAAAPGHVRTAWAALTARPAATAVLVPASAMLVLGLWGLDRESMWRDEGVTHQVATRSLPEIVRLLGSADAVHGLYYLLMHAVLAVHPGEVALRLPSVLAGAATAALVAALGVRLARPRVGLWAGLLYAATPLTGYYAQEGRSYALVAAGVTGATLLLVRAVRQGRVKDWCLYGSVVTATVLLHQLAALILLAHAVTLLLSWKRLDRQAWRNWAVCGCAALTVLLPLARLTLGQSEHTAWLAGSEEGSSASLLKAFAGPTELVLTAALLLACVSLNSPLERTGRLSLNAVAMPMMVLPPLVLLAASQYTPLHHDRYLFFALAGAPLCAAAGAERIARGVRMMRSRPGRRSGGAVFGAAVVGLAFCWQLPLHQGDRTTEQRPDDPAAVAQLVAERIGPGDAMLYLPSVGRRTALAYPREFQNTNDIALARTAAASGTLYGEETGPAELRRRLADLEHVWLLAEPYAASAEWNPKSATERAKLTVVNEEFLLRDEYQTRGGVLRHYLRRPPDKPVGWPPAE